MACNIISVGKRRDGGTRYWCLKHRADATAKYGRKDTQCRYAGVPVIAPGETIRLDVADYPGGVAIWGAVPPVYDTTRLPMDKGIHVHARSRTNGPKEMDRTARRVVIVKDGQEFEVSELDAIYYMTSSVFGFPTARIECPRCGYSHLDRDWFSIHPHQSHLCAACGRTFRDSKVAIGNPAAQVQDALSPNPPKSKKATTALRIAQAAYPAGIQVWGSNPAIVWTGSGQQEDGIHVHAFSVDGGKPTVDGTFSSVFIDGIALSVRQVRTLMAQSALPHLKDRISAVDCERCGAMVFDEGADAYTPREERTCARCYRRVRTRGRLRKVVSNPLLLVLERLTARAPRPPQVHDLGLLPETL